MEDTQRLRLWLPLWLLVMYICSHGYIEGCNPIPLSDVKAAVEASSNIYTDKITLGGYIPNTRFKVVNMVTPKLHGEPLRAIVATSGSTTLICFRGTINVKQLVQEFTSAMKPGQPLLYRGRVMYVMKYFWKALNRFSPETLVPGGIESGRKYIVTGHSLGGALASLYSIYAKLRSKGLWDNPHSSLITFGTPRVGDRHYAEFHDKLIPADQKLRFINQLDIVPHLPPRLWYAHHSREIWIWKQKVFGHWVINWTVCKDGDDPSGCSVATKVKEPFSHNVWTYREEIITGPEVYYDKNGKSWESFENSQCR